MSARQHQRCVVEVVADAATSCAIKLGVNSTAAFWPRELSVGLTISHTCALPNPTIRDEMLCDSSKTPGDLDRLSYGTFAV